MKHTPETRPEDAAERTLRPRVDLYEDEAGYELEVELPGVAEKDLEVTLEDDLLRIRGRVREEAPEGFALGLAEHGPGTFERDFRVGPELDGEAIEASLAGGLLRVRIPRRRKQRSIPITSG